jgi:putative inorganic carbon (HCO3(-)) transporter
VASSKAASGPRPGLKTAVKSKKPTGKPVAPKVVVAPTPSATAGMDGPQKAIWLCLSLLVLLVPVAMSNFNWLSGLVSGSSGLPLTYDQFDIVKVFIMRACALAGLAVWVFEFFMKGGKIRRTKLDWLIVGFLGWVLLTSFTSISPATALFGKYRRFEGFFSFATYAIVYFLVVQMADRPSRIRSLARTFMFSSLVVSGYGVLQYLGLDPINWGANLPFEANRAFSTFGNPDLLGGFLIFPLAISLSLALSEKRTGWRIFYWATFLITVAAWIVAFVRGAWIGGAVALVVLGIAIFLARPKPTVVDWSAGGLTGLAAIWLVIKSVMSGSDVMNVVARLKSIFAFGEGSAVSRFEIWQAAIDATKAKPLFGFGADTFRLVFPKYKPVAYVKDAGYLSVADNVHNYPLQLMAGIGIIGFLLLYGLFGWALWLAAPNAFSRGKGTERLVIAGFWAASIGYITHLMTGLSVTGSTVFLWLALAIIVSPTAVEREHKAPAWGGVTGTLLIAVLSLAFVGNVVFIVADNYFLRGQFPAAGENPIELTKTAIALDPYNDIYRSMLGKAYENQVQYWLTQANTDQTSGKDPAASVQSAKDYFLLAEASYKETIAIVPTEYDNYLFLAALYNQGGRTFDPKMFDLALQTADAGIAVEPYGPGVRLQKAVAQENKGDDAGALATLAAAVDMDPAYTDIHVFYAQLLQRTGKLSEAAARWKALLATDPTNTTYSDAIKAIEASISPSATGTTAP